VRTGKYVRMRSVGGRAAVAVGWGVTVVLALAAGRWVERGGTAHAAPAAAATVAPDERPAAPAPVVVLSGGGGSSLDADQVRRIVREELARAPSAASAGAPEKPASPPAAVTPEAQAAIDEATALVDRAVVAGRWTPADRQAFAALRGSLPPDAMIEVERTLNVAINRGEVVPTDTLPPFAFVGLER
jgi:hypothetical protein